MKHVISNRVKAGLRDPLPPGAVEAEFAYHMSRAMRGGLDAVPMETKFIEVKVVEPEPVIEMEVAPTVPSRRVLKAIEGVERLKQLRLVREGISEVNVADALQITKAWVKGMRKRDNWAVLSPWGPRQPALYLLDSVIESARQRVVEVMSQQKRKRGND